MAKHVLFAEKWKISQTKIDEIKKCAINNKFIQINYENQDYLIIAKNMEEGLFHKNLLTLFLKYKKPKLIFDKNSKNKDSDEQYDTKLPKEDEQLNYKLKGAGFLRYSSKENKLVMKDKSLEYNIKPDNNLNQFKIELGIDIIIQ